MGRLAAQAYFSPMSAAAPSPHVQPICPSVRLLHDADACAKAGIPFVNLSHVSPIQEGDEGLGFALYREWIAEARRSGLDIRSLTLSEIAESWGSGETAATEKEETS